MQENGQYEVGEIYYAAGGAKVRLDAVTISGQYVVSKLLHYVGFHDDFYEEFGPAEIVDKIFEKPPLEVVDADIASKLTKLQVIEQRHAKAFAELNSVERETKDRLAKFKKFRGLELLEDFIDKKITHFVSASDENSFDFKIISFDEAIKSKDRDAYQYPFRLVTLFGRSDGDLQWRVDAYYDGSGGSRQCIWPCRDEQHAKDTILAIIIQRLEVQYLHAVNAKQSYWFIAAYDAAIKYGAAPSNEQEAKYRELKAASLTGQIAGARKNLEAAQTSLNKLLQEQERLPS